MERGSQVETLEVPQQYDLVEDLAELEIPIGKYILPVKDLVDKCPIDLSDPRITLEMKNDFVIKRINKAGMAIDEKYERQFADTLERHGIERKFTVAVAGPNQLTETWQHVELKSVPANATEKLSKRIPEVKDVEVPIATVTESAGAATPRHEYEAVAEVNFAEQSARQAVAQAFIEDVTLRNSTEGTRSEPGDALPNAKDLTLEAERFTQTITRPEEDYVASAEAKYRGAHTGEVVETPEGMPSVSGTHVGGLDLPEPPTIGTEPFSETYDESNSLESRIASFEDIVALHNIEMLLFSAETVENNQEYRVASIAEAEKAVEKPLFTERIAAFAERTVDLDRRPAMEAMLNRIYGIIETEVELVMAWAEEVEGVGEIESRELIMTDELQAIVTMVLQEFGVVEPALEQIERFVTLIKLEKIASSKISGAHDAAESDGKEHVRDFTTAVWRRYQTFWRLHQPLGKIVLAA